MGRVLWKLAVLKTYPVMQVSIDLEISRGMQECNRSVGLLTFLHWVCTSRTGSHGNATKSPMQSRACLKPSVIDHRFTTAQVQKCDHGTGNCWWWHPGRHGETQGSRAGTGSAAETPWEEKGCQTTCEDYNSRTSRCKHTEYFGNFEMLPCRLIMDTSKLCAINISLQPDSDEDEPQGKKSRPGGVSSLLFYPLVKSLYICTYIQSCVQ